MMAKKKTFTVDQLIQRMSVYGELEMCKDFSGWRVTHESNVGAISSFFGPDKPLLEVLRKFEQTLCEKGKLVHKKMSEQMESISKNGQGINEERVEQATKAMREGLKKSDCEHDWVSYKSITKQMDVKGGVGRSMTTVQSIICSHGDCNKIRELRNE